MIVADNKRILQLAYFLLCGLPLMLALGRALAEISICSIGILFIFYSWSTRDFAWVKRPEVKAGLLLVAYLIVHAIIMQGIGGALMRASLWLRFIVLFAAMRYWLLVEERQRQIMYYCTFATLCILMLDAWWQYIAGTSLSGVPIAGERLTAMMSHPNVGNLMVKLLFVPMGYMLLFAGSTQSPLKRYSIIGALLSIVLLIPLTGERSSTLLLLMGLVLIGGIITVSKPAARKYVVLGLALCAVLVAVLSTQDIIQRRAVLFGEQLQHFPETTYGQLYKAAYLLWQDSPAFGIGLHRFRKECMALMEPHNITYCDVHPHNFYLEWLAEHGLVGFALLMAVLLTAVVPTLKSALGRIRAGEIMPVFGLASLAVVLFPFIVTQSHFSNWPGMLYWFSLALSISAFNRGSQS